MRSLQKWHGAGNDFLVDVQDGAHDVEPAPWTPERARAVCTRTTGVGADGLLVAHVGPVVEMTLFNADGSTAEMSGNGIRCLAGAVRRATSSTWDSLEVVTPAGTRLVRLLMNGTVGRASVDMGEVTFAETIEGSLGVAQVGNPHVVVVDDSTWSDATREERAGQWSARVGGANVEFVKFVEFHGSAQLSIRVVERGVGWTRACGTGSCAAAGVARRAGLVGDVVVVDNPGGSLTVEFDGARATLTGPMEFIADVAWCDE